MVHCDVRRRVAMTLGCLEAIALLLTDALRGEFGYLRWRHPLRWSDFHLADDELVAFVSRGVKSSPSRSGPTTGPDTGSTVQSSVPRTQLQP